jgi:hypothetical protein
MSAFEVYVQTELPRRPVMLTTANTGYDASPNGGGAPPVIANSPTGTFYLQATGGSLWQKLSSTPGTWKLLDATAAGLSQLNRSMSASITTSDNNVACSTPLASSLATWVLVLINGQGCNVGDGVKVGVDCYFSGDSGATPRPYGTLAIGDYLYWNGSVAGYQLSASDKIDFVYSK